MNLQSDAPPRPPTLTARVLVLSYNMRELAQRALHSAVALEGRRVAEYILFDNGSLNPPPDGIDSRIRVIRGLLPRQPDKQVKTCGTRHGSPPVFPRFYP